MNKVIKICGMKDAANIAEVATLLPDWMGFIFYPLSLRYVGADFKMPAIPSAIKRVGVFVNQEIDLIQKLVRMHSLDFVQLHGDEPVSQAYYLHVQGLKVIKAFRVDDHFDFDATVEYQPYSDYFLFDTKGKNYGGNNMVFDWSLLKRYNQQTPFLLSGGLNQQNIGEVSFLDTMNCAGYDFNSGVEIDPGLKSTDKIKYLMNFFGRKNLAS